MMDMQKIGSWAFILGVVIAFLAGIGASVEGVLSADFAAWITFILVILGIIVGLLNVKDKEIPNFLIAGIALLATGSISSFLAINTVFFGAWNLGTWLTNIFGNIALFVSPAIVIVALVEIRRIAGTQ